MTNTNPVHLFEIADSCENSSDIMLKDLKTSDKKSGIFNLFGLMLNFKRKPVTEIQLTPIQQFKIDERVQWQKALELQQMHETLCNKKFNVWINKVQQYTTQKYLLELNS